MNASGNSGPAPDKNQGIGVILLQPIKKASRSSIQPNFYGPYINEELVGEALAGYPRQSRYCNQMGSTMKRRSYS